jgi:glycerol-3-phosphate dehydrogenase (NAD+)
MMGMIAAIMRIGANEIKEFCLEYFPTTKAATFMEESCGIADIITSCTNSSFLSDLDTNDGWSNFQGIGGRNRQIAEAMVKQGKVRYVKSP